MSDELRRFVGINELRLRCEIAYLCDTKQQGIDQSKLIRGLLNRNMLVTERVEILERLAQFYDQAGLPEMAREVKSESVKLLPLNCRKPWKNWTMLDEAANLYTTRSSSRN